MSYVSIESGTEVFYSPGWDVLFTIACNDVGEMFCGCVDGCEGVNVETRKVVLYTIGVGGPVGSIIIGVGAFRREGVGAV